MKTVDMLEAQMRKSTDLTRTQLVGMVASLRGELFTLLGLVEQGLLIVGAGEGVREDEEENRDYTHSMLEDARITMKLTEFALQPNDEVDGGFDDSWDGRSGNLRR